MSKEIIKEDGESRQRYLLRVCLAYLENLDEGPYVKDLSETVNYDGADCDGACLIEDIRHALDWEGE